jgi:hypothetical protein
MRGDANADGIVSFTDVLAIGRLVTGQGGVPCVNAADADDGQPVQGCTCDSLAGVVNFSDVLAVFRYLFLFEDWTATLPAPFPEPGPDPTVEDLPCNAYEPAPPAQTLDVIRIGAVEAEPGEEIEIPVFLRNSIEVEGVQLVVRYDQEGFTPTLGRPGVSLQATYYEETFDREFEERFAWVQSQPSSGVFTLGFSASPFQRGFPVAPVRDPDQERLVLNIIGTVSETAGAGSVVSLEPTNGEDGLGTGPYGMRNELTRQEGGLLKAVRPRLLSGMIVVVAATADFLRGDADANGRLEQTDAVFILNWLFLLGTDPACLDAADVTDDGTIQITDAVFLLTHLFLLGPPPPSPQIRPGRDPTPDVLSCRQN